jgi:hypothetical protein
MNARALPDGAQRLLVAELVARGLPGFRLGAMSQVVRIAEQLRLPAFQHSDHDPFEWPRAQLLSPPDGRDEQGSRASRSLTLGLGSTTAHPQERQSPAIESIGTVGTVAGSRIRADPAL